MKAAIYKAYGGSEEISIIEIPTPQPKEHEVLIRVKAATVNRTDCGWLRGKPWFIRFFSGFPYPKHKVLGTEFSGIIEAVGSHVTRFKPGDSVFGFSEFTFGTHAEFMVMPEQGTIANKPEHFSFEEAATLCEGGDYAMNDIKAMNLVPGKKILINGACGGIGSAAIQFAVHLGAEVTAVCTTETIELMKQLGAKHVIDYTKDDFTKANQTYDVVFDSVGKSSFFKCLPILHKRGIYISTELGFMSQNIFLSLFTPLFESKKVLFPFPIFKLKDVLYLYQLAELGVYKPVIDRVYDFSEILEAYKYVEKGQKVGNVVLRFN